MTNRRSKADVLNRDFLETRSRVLDLAAALDRLDRALAPLRIRPTAGSPSFARRSRPSSSPAPAAPRQSSESSPSITIRAGARGSSCP